MTTSFPFSSKKTFSWLSSIFLLMFFCRLFYGYYYPGTANDNGGISLDSEDFSVSRKNYASEKIKGESAPQQQPSLSQSQKFEKIATLRSKSGQFEDDDTRLKTLVKGFAAVIQYEQNTGNPGHRTLNLLIGVKPERFDSFYTEAQKIGRILSKSITKTDKTNEYLQLNAKRISLEKTRNALLELKSRGGKIDEYIGLENRILEIEGQLQELGVQIGDYDEENEFCTIRFSLYEGERTDISFAQRLKVAFEWTAKYYLMLMVGMAFALVAALVLQSIVEKLRPKSIDKS
ncbi:MAG: DUF4349 domain-containing protein [Phycisphaerae bacterium]|nr:DUF4349 domain-containing protein [Saprospiraceae bacterium]